MPRTVTAEEDWSSLQRTEREVLIVEVFRKTWDETRRDRHYFADFFD